jgi:menaquinol-cytochrome c reductase iron-sulfur subunit
VNGSEDGGKSVAPKYNNGQNWFMCPCHDSLYNIYGAPTPSSPAPDPVAVYDYKVDPDGTVYVGQSVARKMATWNQIPGSTLA